MPDHPIDPPGQRRTAMRIGPLGVLLRGSPGWDSFLDQTASAETVPDTVCPETVPDTVCRRFLTPFAD
jgi:hypothetical protein